MFAIDPMDYDHYVGAQRRHRMKLSPRVTPMDPPSIGFFFARSRRASIRGQSTFLLNVLTYTNANDGSQYRGADDVAAIVNPKELARKSVLQKVL